MILAKTINFGAGPAKLPESVMAKIQSELLDYDNEGIGILEMSHRSPTFSGIIGKAEERLRRLVGIGSDYEVLFMQGGGTLQFAAAPMNLAKDKDQVLHYLVTGQWSKKAAEEAKILGYRVNEVELKDLTLEGLDSAKDLIFKDGTPFNIYYCDNETVDGIEFPSASFLSDRWNLDTSKTCLVSDMSSNFLSRPIDISKFGMVFASAQKNVGPAGLTVVVVRKDLIKHAVQLPKMLDYRVFAKEKSLYNTPPSFAIYVTELVLKWLEETFDESLANVDDFSNAKSQMLYNLIDQSNGRLVNQIPPMFRSRMNIIWQMPNTEEEALFFQLSKEASMVQLKGHRLVGGIRASLYNAITLDETEALASLLKSILTRA